MFDTLPVKGVVNFKKITNGVVVEDFTVNNLVVDSGKSWIAERIKDATVATQVMKIGTGTTAVAASDTDLVSVLATSATITPNNVANTVQYVGTFTGVTGAVTEAGIFADATLICRTTFSSIGLTADDTLSITWTLTIG